MRHSRAPKDDFFFSQTYDKLFFRSIFLLFIALSLYKFSVPSMWHDEMMVAVSTWSDILAIIRKYYFTDFHPPYYAILIKLQSYISSNSTFLKLLSPIAISGSILVAHKGGQHLGWRFQIPLAVIMATCFWCILLSRQLRPYAISLFLSTYCFYTIINFIHGIRPNILLYSLSLSTLGILHYANMLIIAPQGIMILYILWKTKSKDSIRMTFGYALSTIISLSLILPFYMHSSTAWMKEKPFSDRIIAFIYNIISLLTGSNIQSYSPDLNSITPLIILTTTLAIVTIFILYGFCSALKKNIDTAAFIFLWIAPLTLYITIPSKQYGEFQEWHLVPILPALFFLFATGSSKLRHGRLFCIIFFLASLLNIYCNRDILYTEHGSKGIYKTIASMICSQSTDTFSIISSNLSHTFTSWYARNEFESNKFEDISILPSSNPITLAFYAGAGVLPEAIDTDDESIANTHFNNIKPASHTLSTRNMLGTEKSFNIRIYKTTLARRTPPTVSLQSGHAPLISKNPIETINNIYTLKDMSIKPMSGDYKGGSTDFYVFPSKHGSQGIISFLITDINPNHKTLKISSEHIINTYGQITIAVTDPGNNIIYKQILTNTPEISQKAHLQIASLNSPQLLVTVTIASEDFPHMMVHSNTNIGIRSLTVSTY